MDFTWGEKLRAYVRPAGTWFAAKLTWLDSKADQKLGFIAAPTLGTLLGGGIPAWVASRLVMLAIVGGGLWYVVGKYNDGVVAARDKQWEVKLAAEMAKADREAKIQAENTRKQVARTAAAWEDAHADLTQYTDTLEGILKARTKDYDALQKKCAVSQKAVEVLRQKVQRINKRSYK